MSRVHDNNTLFIHVSFQTLLHVNRKIIGRKYPYLESLPESESEDREELREIWCLDRICMI